MRVKEEGEEEEEEEEEGRCITTILTGTAMALSPLPGLIICLFLRLMEVCHPCTHTLLLLLLPLLLLLLLQLLLRGEGCM